MLGRNNPAERAISFYIVLIFKYPVTHRIVSRRVAIEMEKKSYSVKRTANYEVVTSFISCVEKRPVD